MGRTVSHNFRTNYYRALGSPEPFFKPNDVTDLVMTHIPFIVIFIYAVHSTRTFSIQRFSCFNVPTNRHTSFLYEYDNDNDDGKRAMISFLQHSKITMNFYCMPFKLVSEVLLFVADLMSSAQCVFVFECGVFLFCIHTWNRLYNLFNAIDSMMFSTDNCLNVQAMMSAQSQKANYFSFI